MGRRPRKAGTWPCCSSRVFAAAPGSGSTDGSTRCWSAVPDRQSESRRPSESCIRSLAATAHRLMLEAAVLYTDNLRSPSEADERVDQPCHDSPFSLRHRRKEDLVGSPCPRHKAWSHWGLNVESDPSGSARQLKTSRRSN